MQTLLPDIVVTSPDGEYLMIVEVKTNDTGDLDQNAVGQLKHYMSYFGCSVGLIVSGDRVVLLRDSLEKFHGESIAVVGEAKLPTSLLPPADEQWKDIPDLEFESRVQRWLEKLKRPSNVENLPDDLRKLLGEPIMSLLQWGEVRAARPRWSRVAT
jgi:Type I restriction enzyme R protein N terminus (HSDR_N)